MIHVHYGLNNSNHQLPRKTTQFIFQCFVNTIAINPDVLIQLAPKQITAMVINYIMHTKKGAKQTAGKAATFSRATNRPNPLLEYSINKQMKFLMRKAGLSFEELQPDHSLRKFFDTTLINSDGTHSFKEILMGHSIKLDEVYYDKNNQLTVELYIRRE
jgi:integrase